MCHGNCMDLTLWPESPQCFLWLVLFSALILCWQGLHIQFQVSLEFNILLSQTPKFWDHRCELPHLTSFCFSFLHLPVYLWARMVMWQLEGRQRSPPVMWVFRAGSSRCQPWQQASSPAEPSPLAFQPRLTMNSFLFTHPSPEGLCFTIVTVMKSTGEY